jgi:hypothetical protein
MFNSAHPALSGRAEFPGKGRCFDRRRAIGTSIDDYSISIADAKAGAAQEASHPQ